MYPTTLDAVAAQAAYRRDRLARDYRRVSIGAPRRWRRAHTVGRSRLS